MQVDPAAAAVTPTMVSMHMPVVPAQPLAMGHSPAAFAASSAFVEVEATHLPQSTAEAGEDGKGNASLQKKNAWSLEEDQILVRVVQEEGAGHWTKIAQRLQGRAGRQCRERWFNHLAPDVKKGSWTAEEDHLILAAVREHGTKWSQIQKQLPGRSDNSIKNRYYSAIRKAQRLEKRTSVPAPVIMLTPQTEASCATDAKTALMSVAGPASCEAIGARMIEQPRLEHMQTDTAAKGIDMRHSGMSNSASPSASPNSAKRKQRAISHSLEAATLTSMASMPNAPAPRPHRHSHCHPSPSPAPSPSLTLSPAPPV